VIVALALNLRLLARFIGFGARVGQAGTVYPKFGVVRQRAAKRWRKEYVDGRNLTYHDLVYSSLKASVGSRTRTANSMTG